MHRLLLAAAIGVASLFVGAAPAQDDKQVACSMAPGMALGLSGFEQADRSLAAVGADLERMRAAAPEVAGLLERFIAESSEFVMVYRQTVGELQRICDQ